MGKQIRDGMVSGFFKGGVAIVKKLRLGSAVDSDIAMLIVTASVSGLGVFISQTLWPLLLIVIPIVGYLRHYEYFMKNNPNMLRSEKHEENMRRIDVGAMGDDKRSIDGEVLDEQPSTSGSENLIENHKKGAKK